MHYHIILGALLSQKLFSKTKHVLILLSAISCLSFHFTSCSDERCVGENKKIMLKYKDINFPIQQGEVKQYLHNNIDTQQFVCTNKETYYITEGARDENECPRDYEWLVATINNVTAGNYLTMKYERNRNLFPNLIASNSHTSYILSYNTKHFYKELAFYTDSIIINSKKYGYVIKYGDDSLNNYFLFNGLGIIRIRIDGENWDLLN